MKRLAMLLAVVFVLGLALPAFAAFNGQIPESGPHWQVNFIGVPKGKKVDMTDTKRRTVFIPLDAAGNQAPTKIYYKTNPSDPDTFMVVDGNGTDANGATIQVPFEAIDPAVGGSNFLSYNVYAVALGKPVGGAVITAHCTYSEDVITSDGKNTCDASLLMGSFDLARTKGTKPVVKDITNIFRASGCFDVAGEAGVCDTGDYVFSNVWIFNIPYLQEYYWDYDNNGLKLMQVRFYQTTSGTWTVK